MSSSNNNKSNSISNNYKTITAIQTYYIQKIQNSPPNPNNNNTGPKVLATLISVPEISKTEKGKTPKFNKIKIKIKEEDPPVLNSLIIITILILVRNNKYTTFKNRLAIVYLIATTNNNKS